MSTALDPEDSLGGPGRAQDGPQDSPTRPVTTRAHRTRAMTAYVVAFLVWTHFIGLPNDPIGIFLWMWAAGIAWNADAPWSYHKRFPMDWWPALLGLAVYWFTRGLADNDGIPIHTMMPIHFDTWLSSSLGFAHQIPTVQLQHALCATPCLRSTPTHWYDLVFSIVYASHFFLGLTIAAVLWTRNREAWKIWMRRYLVLNYATLVIYFAYPMEPPWMASNQGHIVEVHRITSRGFAAIGLERANIILQGMGNQVAAMPSLHAGTAFLVAFYGIWKLKSAWRFLLIAYPLAMCVTLLYFAEHYVIDELVGMVMAALVMIGCRAWELRQTAKLEEPVAAAAL
ncbi:MAG TPA: phosphatase PAP2 family protein [Marmoricola sp.]|nr:phosphatase PAP2 family protein [Marmoricola sp.]